MIHRDLKPENVVITATATGGEIVKVLDFGLAKMRAAGEETGGLTHPGAVMGTAGYMAPEQLTAGEVDDRTDVFSIGVMVAEAIIGQRPFRGRTSSELLVSILNNPVTLGGDGAELRAPRVDVLRRATAHDRAGRYESVAALMQDLVPALHACRPSARTVGNSYKLATRKDDRDRRNREQQTRNWSSQSLESLRACLSGLARRERE